MKSLLVRVLLTALAFFFVLPMVNGITFHGNFFHAIALGAFFAIMLWLVNEALAWFSIFFAIGTLGLGILLLIPMWLVAFWVVPAVALKLVADIMSAYLTVAGFWPAFWGGLILLVIQLLSGGVTVRASKR